MNRKVTIQDFIDSLGMANQITSINGETPCAAIMALYTVREMMEFGAKGVGGVSYDS